MERPRNISSNTATSPATATMTITITPPEERPQTSPVPPVITLKLKPKRKSNENRHIHWSEDTIDNENLNKKKSNICCIFHPNESDDHDCTGCPDEQEIPAGKNVYEFQPQYKKNNKPNES